MLTEEDKKLIAEIEYDAIKALFKPPSRIQKITDFANDIVSLIISLGIIASVILAILLIIWFVIFIIFSAASFGWHLFT